MGQRVRIGSKKGLPKKLLIVGGIFVVVTGATGALLVMRPWAQQASNDTTPEVSLNAVERADILADEGNYEGSQQLLDTELLARATTIDEKQQVYVQKAALALRNEKYDEAMTYAKEAEKVRADKLAVRLMAQIAQTSGNKPLAAEYYTKVLSMYTDEERNSDAGALQYQSDESALQEVSQ